MIETCLLTSQAPQVETNSEVGLPDERTSNDLLQPETQQFHVIP